MTSIFKKTWVRTLALLVLIGAVALGYFAYQTLYGGNVANNLKDGYLYVRTGSTFEDVMHYLTENAILKNPAEFERVARKMNYPRHIIPGRYKLKPGQGNYELVTMLRSGQQEPVKFTLGKFRSLDEIAAAVGRKLEGTTSDMKALYENEAFLDSLGYTQQTLMGMFIPDTYELKWNTSARQFLTKMKAQNTVFWTGARTRKADALHLSRAQVSILASIVEEETLKNDEKPTIAGVYYNRYQKNMKLEADPTVKFASGDFAARRITRDLLNTESPYNTYRNVGLPPGPICTPSQASLNAVLNLEDHNYIYFCAKEDFSGYHNFAATLAQHNLNAPPIPQSLKRSRHI